MGYERAPVLIVLSPPLTLQAFILFSLGAAYPNPIKCRDTTRLCTSFLAFKPTSEQTLPVIQSMFDALQEDLTVEGNGRNYIFIRKNCFCASGLNIYLTNKTFTVRKNNRSVYDLLIDSYDGLAYFPLNFTREARKGAVVSLRLMCGCSSGLWNYLMSYVMRDGDSVESLASRFGVSMDSIETTNGIANPDNFTVRKLYYIPMNSVPGEPYPIKNDTHPAPVPAPSADSFLDNVNHKTRVPSWWIIGSAAIGLALVVVVVLLFVSLRSSGCCNGSQGSRTKDSDWNISHKFYVLQNTSFCCASGRSICCKSEDWNHTNVESSNRQTKIPTVIGTNVFDVEKFVVFTFEEILSSTDGFLDSNLLGRGHMVQCIMISSGTRKLP